LLDRLENVSDDLLLFFRIQARQTFAVGGAMPHELPSAFFHFFHGLGEGLAELRIQSDGCLEARRIQHVGDTP
jgi:hypothetical protein